MVFSSPLLNQLWWTPHAAAVAVAAAAAVCSASPVEPADTVATAENPGTWLVNMEMFRTQILPANTPGAAAKNNMQSIPVANKTGIDL